MSNKPKTRNLIFTALLAAFMAILGPLSIPLPGGVPLSLLTFALFLSAYLLGWRLGTLAVVVYLLLGFFGVPVFSGFTAGAGKLLGPTGGYLIGYITSALLCGFLMQLLCKEKTTWWGVAIASLVGLASCYVLGTIWFIYLSGTGLVASLTMCVFPFLPGDALKTVVIVLLVRKLRPALQRTLQR